MTARTPKNVKLKDGIRGTEQKQFVMQWKLALTFGWHQYLYPKVFLQQFYMYHFTKSL